MIAPITDREHLMLLEADLANARERIAELEAALEPLYVLDAMFDAMFDALREKTDASGWHPTQPRLR